MDPVQAYKHGIDPNEVLIGCEAGKFAGKWIAYLPDEVRGKYILTESHDIYELCWWKAQIKLLRGELPLGS